MVAAFPGRPTLRNSPKEAANIHHRQGHDRHHGSVVGKCLGAWAIGDVHGHRERRKAGFWVRRAVLAVFKNGNTILATKPLSGGQAVFPTTSLPRGTYTITASYAGDNNFIASSGKLNET